MIRNLFDGLPAGAPDEVFTRLAGAERFTLERIVSTGQATPPGQWCDQEDHEWVVLLKGRAGLRFDGESEVHVLKAGDYVLIPARTRHRVEWTDQRAPTVWLALHFRGRTTTLE